MQDRCNSVVATDVLFNAGAHPESVLEGLAPNSGRAWGRCYGKRSRSITMGTSFVRVTHVAVRLLVTDPCVVAGAPA